MARSWQDCCTLSVWTSCYLGRADLIGEAGGDSVVAAAMIDRLVHHAEVVSMRGDGYRLKDRDLGRVPNDDTA